MKTLLGWLSPPGDQARLSVLIFHRVLQQPDPLFPDEMHAVRFDRLCGWLAQWFKVLPLDEAWQLLQAGRLPARALAVSFDDGYADNHDVALPILKRHGLSATFFVSTGFLDGACMWNDIVIEAVRSTRNPSLVLDGLAPGLPASVELNQVESRQTAIRSLLGHLKYLPPAERQTAVVELFKRARTGAPLPAPMMSRSKVVALRRAGMQIGAHTVSHPILARLDTDAARHEIEQSKQTLESLLDEPVTLFAYPNGRPGEDFNAETVKLVQAAGFSAAVTTAWGAARRDSPAFEIPRFTPWDRGRLKFALRMAANFRQPPQLAM